MTYAPEVLLELRAYAISELDADPLGVGIVGDANHNAGYHCGADRIFNARAGGAGWSDYSARTIRDRLGLRARTKDAACALDLTTGSRRHREWLAGLLADLLAGEDYTLGIRAINGTLNGRSAYRWDREHRFVMTRTDSSHLTHTHIEWYRDVIAKPPRTLLPVLIRPLQVTSKGATAVAAPEEDVDSVASEDQLKALLEYLMTGKRYGKSPTAPDPELGSAYIGLSHRLLQRIDKHISDNNDVLREILAKLGDGK